MKETLKPYKLFKTRKQVAKFREELEDGTKERFAEIDASKRKAIAKAQYIVLD